MVVDPTDDCTFWYTNEYYDSVASGAAGSNQVIALQSGSPTRLSNKGHNATTTLPAITTIGGTLRA